MKRICKQCGKEIDKGFIYCPKCGLQRLKTARKRATLKYYSDSAKYQRHLTRVKSRYLLKIGKIGKADRCLICGSQDNLQLHHLTYTGKYSTAAVITLCRKCHAAERKHTVQDNSPKIKVISYRFK